MRVMKRRWGEITIKKQGEGKNQFDQTRSFSIEQSPFECDIDQLRELSILLVELTQLYDFDTLRAKIRALGDHHE
jgi:hypothetical protein